MLTNFFLLNNNTTIQEITSLADFINLLNHSTGLVNMLYKPNQLNPNHTYPKINIQDKTFSNFSFSKTIIKKVTFCNCVFTDCLFIGTSLFDCEFHNCRFINVNTFKIRIKNTLLKPESFDLCLTGRDKANIGVHLYHQLLSNSKEKGSSKDVRLAEFNFKKWDDKLTLSKFLDKKPYPISLYSFLKTYTFNFIFRWTFGYGLRFRNFFVTFSITFLLFFIINYSRWNHYSLTHKDTIINAFNPDSVNLSSNLFYTLDVTTKLIDSQIQPQSNEGMMWLSIQSIVAFVLLSALATILVNRFVK